MWTIHSMMAFPLTYGPFGTRCSERLLLLVDYSQDMQVTFNIGLRKYLGRKIHWEMKNPKAKRKDKGDRLLLIIAAIAYFH